MGLGGVDVDELEWVDLRVEPELPPLPSGAGPLAEAMQAWAAQHLSWEPGAGRRVLLVDLDNIRADTATLSGRLALLAVLAAGADHVVLAGQDGAVARSRPWLGVMGPTAYAVPAGRNEADYLLLDEATALVRGRRAQFVVASNDGIFARLATLGPLTLLSPRIGDLSGRLLEAAEMVLDLATLEDELRQGLPPGPGRPVEELSAGAAGPRQERPDDLEGPGGP